MQSFLCEPPRSRQFGLRPSVATWRLPLAGLVSILLTISISQVESFNGGIGISLVRSSPVVMRSQKGRIERSVRTRMNSLDTIGDSFAFANPLQRRCISEGSPFGNTVENKMRSLMLFSSAVRRSHGISESDEDNASSTLECETLNLESNEAAVDFQLISEGDNCTSPVLESDTLDSESNEADVESQSGGGSISLREDKEFKAAVEEVKDAAKNVTSSAIGLTTTIATKGPGILGRLLAAIVSIELRLVHIIVYSFLYREGIYQRLHWFFL